MLLIDASELGTRKRLQLVLSDSDIQKIVRCCQTAGSAGGLNPVPEDLPYVAVRTEVLLGGDCRLMASHWRSAHTEEHLTRRRSAYEELRTATASLSAAVALEDLEIGGPRTVALSELTEAIVRGVRIPPERLGRGSTPMITKGDLRADWSADPSATVDLDNFDKVVPRSRPGDVLVAVDDGRVRCAVDHAGGSVISAPLQCLRLRNRSEDHSLILAALLSGTPTPGTVSYADIRDLDIAWPAPEHVARVAKLLRSAAAQHQVARNVATAAETLVASTVAALAGGARPAGHHKPVAPR